MAYSQSYVQPERRWVGVAIRWAVVLLVMYFVFRWVAGLFSGGSVERTSVILQMKDGAAVDVALEGEDWQRAENGVKLYAGDKVRTGGGGQATLGFFDGATATLDASTAVSIDKSQQGDKNAGYDVTVSQGQLFIMTPSVQTFSGSVLRNISTPAFAFQIPTGAKALVRQSGIAVFEADGLGVTTTVGNRDAIVIGEGQMWTATNTTNLATDLYSYRSVIDSTVTSAPFVTAALASAPTGTTGIVGTGAEKLVVSSPKQNDVVTAPTVKVQGSTSADVVRVTVNGYQAPLNQTNHTFAQDISLSSEQTATIAVQAYDSEGTLIGDVRRTIKRQAQAVAGPTIEVPATNGQTYRTQAEEVVLRGKAPPGATGIMVNDYRLKLFDPAKGTWSYIASTKVGNMKAGTNTFDVVALYGDATNPQKSDPAVLTILWEEGTEGVVAGATTSGASSSKSSVNPATLPSNDPTAAGTLKVTAPVEGTAAVITGTGTLIEGTTSNKTASIWVNDYQLQLYKPGVTTWNYIAALEYKNLAKGENTFTIIARDKDNQILDKLVYKITLE